MIKKILFSTLFMMIGYCSFGQSGMYLVNLVSINDGQITHDLMITNPQGSSTTLQMPSLTQDPEGFYNFLNTEFNNLIDQGYKLMNQPIASGIGVSANGVSKTYFTYYFAIP